MTSKKKSLSTAPETMGKRHLQKILAAALAPCYGDPPTAAAVIIVTGGGRGVKHFSLNMEPLEVVHTLITAGMHINDSMSLHKIPEVLQ